MTTDVDVLKQLQLWYLSQCDGGWEHQYGVKIGTLDNPGWSLKVDLVGTALSGRSFDGVKFDGTDDNDWYRCQIQDHKFKGFCGPTRLSDVIAIFLNWAERV